MLKKKPELDNEGARTDFYARTNAVGEIDFLELCPPQVQQQRWGFIAKEKHQGESD